MKFTTALLVLTGLAALTGCTGMKVSSDHNASYDFGQITTYQWIDAPEEIREQDDTYLNIDVQKGLNNQLAVRGWKQVLETSEASVQVVYYIKLKEQEEYSTAANQTDREFSGGFVYNRDKSSWGYEEREPDLNVYTVEIGTLTVLIYDAKTGERIWRGSLQTKLDRAKPIEKQNDRIRAVARKLLNRIPMD
jgi:hypothetical protein